MTTVFIAGSISISRLHEKVQERISKIVGSSFDVVVGDADGADTSIQQCLQTYQADKVTVYCTGDEPRNNVAEWPVRRVQSNARAGSRAFFTAKDIEMARSSDYGLMIWDCKSTGTLSNVIELLRSKKKSVVFVNKNKDFVTISDKAGLEHLVSFMSAHARAKAEEKIGLSLKIAGISQEQLSLEPIAPLAKLDDTAVVSEPSSRVEESPALSESMRLRSALMTALKEHIVRTHLSQSQAAKVFGVTQPRISDLTRGKADVFGLDALVNMAAMAGLRVEMNVHEAMS
ncbi:Xre family transcriptional regulator (plasmid) [Methylorubrum populi]|jgi:predicted XRE-type DNA-binding protein|uniref:Xre family transcriptional regulator n=1 Tax=Methylorubrum populi TaxID=223967 RepID=A0A160PLW5_9HYPH|nr:MULTISPECIES: XRE family transcriptional regulator [Hyphomicrobiales]MDH2228078.1 XRE family transcriptional regulator [Agrobacterium sp. GD03642]BAU94204.1 Xre family transcriptional regulator [Methylorubrum populi]